MSQQITDALSEFLDDHVPSDVESGLPKSDSRTANHEHAVSLDLPDFGKQVEQRESAGAASEDQVLITIELGHVTLDDERFDRLKDDDVVALDCHVDDPVDIFADGKLTARGELVVLNDRMCVRIVETFASD